MSFCQVLREAYPSWDNETRRWSMHMRNIEVKDLESMSSTKSRIRSVFVFSVRKLPKQQLLCTLSVNFKLLKVLDLQGAPLDQLHEEVGTLLQLRYLSIKGTKVTIIPKSIGNLHNLQTLNLRGSLVNSLKIEILSRLYKLRHLIGGGVEGLNIQGRIGHLEELQTLRNVEASVDLIEDLENLRQLRKLCIRNLERGHGKALSTAIEKMKHLQTLRVWAIDSKFLDLYFLSSAPESLQHLYLNGHLKTLPNWISRLDNLVSLDLSVGAHEGQLYFDAGGFLKLKSLSLRFLGRLNSVIIEKGGLPVIEVLAIGSWSQLKEVPSGIRNLSKLKSLRIDYMATEFFDKSQHYWVIENNDKFVWTSRVKFQEVGEVGSDMDTDTNTHMNT